ncbi:anthranilate synthase component I family protein [Nocardioides sp. YIM 152315]|uniref:anthranilate synthase component I family protein n=1 Tax=Nocardioides sp. YIM 152315 TaxID=3031760 RepID=UPI0023DAD5D9|nr:anthranilate synthase component I family protein [Nocardioides sp. YIM 152315]MDF1604295.1 anthranilate synthase component I family protein [Nocardioides sp. YIM 152315]
MTDPVPVFRSVASSHARCFWLDGGGAREWSGRRSIVGWLEESDVSLTYDAAARVVTRHAGGRAEVVGDDVFDVLAAELASGPADASWFGYLGYACRPDLPAAVGGDLPDAVWMRPSRVRVFEHPLLGQNARFSGVATAEKRGNTRCTGYSAAPTAYAAAFDRVQEHLHAGNTYEVNLTYRAECASELDPAAAYLRLRDLNPAPYAGFLQHDVPGARAWLLSSSPERYALVSADRTLETKPIKGTTPRGATAERDEEARQRLCTDPRFRAENLMIVDLLRNDLSMVCEPGTVTVPTLMDVESYESVHQLVSTVRGRLRDEVTTVEALRALFPAGSMTGAPKLRTMEVIDEVEATPRGAYAGAFGWVSADGRADLGVVIRSLMTAGEGRYVLGTGGAVTVRSDVGEEWAESRWKAERLLRVFDGA